MVCVLSDLENESLRVCPFDFMPSTDAAKLLKPWIGSREKGMVDDYDPKIEVVTCFIRKKGENDSYRFKTKPTPPEAAEKE